MKNKGGTSRGSARGFAIIEISLYLGLLAMILTLAILSLVNFTQNNQNNSAINKTIDDLIFLDHKISQAIKNDEDFSITQENEFIYWQSDSVAKTPIMTAPPNSLAVKKLPSDLGYGEILEVTVEVDYLPLTTYHYLP